MFVIDSGNSHFMYMDVVRHWSPESEAYAGGDALVTQLNKGWDIQETVFFEEYWHAGTRPVLIYHIDLVRGDDTLHMPVLSNPYIRRLVDSLPVQVRPVAEQQRALHH